MLTMRTVGNKLCPLGNLCFTWRWDVGTPRKKGEGLKSYSLCP